jgi:hypothetical protein
MALGIATEQSKTAQIYQLNYFESELWA